MSQAKKKVVVVSLVTALSLLGDSMLYVVLPIYWSQAGLVSLWEVGLLLSVNRLVRLPLNPLIGWLYTKISLRTGLAVAVCLAALTTMGYGWVQGLWLWLLLRSLWGFSWSLLRLGGFFTVINYSGEQQRGYLMGLYNGLYRLGSLFGMILGGLLASLFGLTFVATFFGCCSLLGLFLIFWSGDSQFVSKKSKGQVESGGAREEKKELDWFSPHVLKVIGSGFLLTLLINGIFASTLSYLLYYHFSEQVSLFGVVMGAATLAGFLQGARWGWEPFLAAFIGRLSDGPWGRRPFFLGALFLSALGYALLPWSMSIYTWLFFLLVTMQAATALTTLMDALTADVAKTTNAIALMTAYTVALDLGASVGPLIAYLLFLVESGIIYTYLLSAGLFLFIALLWLTSGRKKHAHLENIQQGRKPMEEKERGRTC